MKYFLRKFGFFLLTLWAVVTLNFLIPRLHPGTRPRSWSRAWPARTNSSTRPRSRRCARCSAPRPVAGIQYVHYLGQLLRGNSGSPTRYFPYKVTEVIGQAFWWTAILVTVVQVLSFLVGIAARRVCRLAAQQPLRHGGDAGLDVPRHAAPVLDRAAADLRASATPSGWFPTSGGYEQSTPGLEPRLHLRRALRTRSCRRWRC